MMERKLPLILGLSFTAIILSYMFYRVIWSEVIVYKVRYHPSSTIYAEVCFPLTVSRIQKAADTLPMCQFQLKQMSEYHCLNTLVEPLTPRFRLEHAGELEDARGRTHHLVLAPEAYIDVPDADKPLAIGLAWETEVILSTSSDVQIDAHEVGHACGYHHAYDRLGSLLLISRRHIMSSHTEALGSSIEGMNHKADELSEF